MVIEMLPVLITAIRAAAIANDTAPSIEAAAEPPGQPQAEPEAAAVPLVRTLRRRPGATYATAGNVILPLQFAERMPGWRARPAPRQT